MLGSLEFALDKRLVDDHLAGDIGQLTSLPGLHLHSHRLEVALHAVDTYRNAVNEGGRLRVLRQDWSECTGPGPAQSDAATLARRASSTPLIPGSSIQCSSSSGIK